ncbi:MAG TPA: uracil phosphoribosyltransferase [Holophagaceae bacterium]|nr:uracil phosphoribosyltransferase [Holophagaceae bacterium]
MALVLSHPLVDHKLSILRDYRTPRPLFRDLLDELGLILAVEATRDLVTVPFAIETPLESMEGRRLDPLDPVLVPVLRAGLGLVPSFLRMLPAAKVGHLGMARDHETLRPVPYYKNFPPELHKRPIFVLDPMLATGGSACEALAEVKAAGGNRITLVCLLASPEGVAKVEGTHPNVKVVVGAVDRQLNAKGYILPGLGDAGDRLFGTV